MKPVRISRLKRMGQSPAHYRGAEDMDEYHLERGDAVHSIVLGGKKVVAYPGPVRRGKEFEAFRAAHPGEIILTKAEEAKANAMAEAVMRHGPAVEVLAGRAEVELDWKFLGRACQSHIDVLEPRGRHITELKTTRCAAKSAFEWQALKLGYNAQVAFYDEAVRSSGLGRPEAHYFVAVESAPPYVVAVRRLTDRALEQGRRAFRLWFERLLACEAADHWPGYCEAIEDHDNPVEDDLDLVFPAEANDDDDAEAA